MSHSAGCGWYLNADVKKTFIDTNIRWNGTGVRADTDLDPWIFSAGLGYRFNLRDIFGHGAQIVSVPIKQRRELGWAWSGPAGPFFVPSCRGEAPF